MSVFPNCTRSHAITYTNYEPAGDREITYRGSNKEQKSVAYQLEIKLHLLLFITRKYTIIKTNLKDIKVNGLNLGES